VYRVARIEATAERIAPREVDLYSRRIVQRTRFLTSVAATVALALLGACGGDKSNQPRAKPRLALTGRDTVSVGDTIVLAAVADFATLPSETLGSAVYTVGWSDAASLTLTSLTQTVGSDLRYAIVGSNSLHLAVSTPNNSAATYTTARVGWVVTPSAAGKALTFSITPTAIYGAHTFDPLLDKVAAGNKTVHVR
jgi:hypothetical protein